MANKTYAQKYANLYKLATSNPSESQNNLIKIAQERGYGFRKNEMRELIRQVKSGKTLKQSKATNEKLKKTVKEKTPIQFRRYRLIREIEGSSGIYIKRYATKNYIVEGDPEEDKNWYNSALKAYNNYKKLAKKRGKLKGKRSYRKYVLNARAEIDNEIHTISSEGFTDQFKEFEDFEIVYESWFNNLVKIAQSIKGILEVNWFWVGFTEYLDRR